MWGGYFQASSSLLACVWCKAFWIFQRTRTHNHLFMRSPSASMTIWRRSGKPLPASSRVGRPPLHKTREFVVWARIFNTKPELNDFRVAVYNVVTKRGPREICFGLPSAIEIRSARFPRYRYLGKRALLICYRRGEPKTYFTGTSLGDAILHGCPENRSARVR